MDLELTRREFLKLSVVVGFEVAVGPIPCRDLTVEERHTLLQVVRTLFPHESVGNGPYAAAVRAIEDRCSRDPAALEAITDGVAIFDRWRAGLPASASRTRRLRLLESAKGSQFFDVVYSEALESLYGSPRVWRLFVRPALSANQAS